MWRFFRSFGTWRQGWDRVKSVTGRNWWENMFWDVSELLECARVRRIDIRASFEKWCFSKFSKTSLRFFQLFDTHFENPQIQEPKSRKFPKFQDPARLWRNDEELPGDVPRFSNLTMDVLNRSAGLQHSRWSQLIAAKAWGSSLSSWQQQQQHPARKTQIWTAPQNENRPEGRDKN